MPSSVCSCRNVNWVGRNVKPAGVAVIVTTFGVVELVRDGRHVSTGEFSDPRAGGVRLRGQADYEMVRFLLAMRIEDVAVEVLLHRAVNRAAQGPCSVSKVD